MQLLESSRQEFKNNFTQHSQTAQEDIHGPNHNLVYSCSTSSI